MAAMKILYCVQKQTRLLTDKERVVISESDKEMDVILVLCEYRHDRYCVRVLC